jgi:hypothetical protein
MWWMANLAVAGPMVTESLGGNGTEATGGSSYKLDVLEVADAVRLVSFAQRVRHVTFSGPDEVWFTVYEETTFNDWDLVWDSGPLPVGGGGGLKQSPEIAIELTGGVRYAVGVYLGEGQFTYEFDDPATVHDFGWAVTGGSVWSTGDFFGGGGPPQTITNSPPDDHQYEMEVTVELLDVDGDGFQEPDDCDDEVATTFPGAPELCDGVDNDCTGKPDDPIDHVYWYEDRDQDGFGGLEHDLCDGSLPEDGWLEVGGDCDDENDLVHPEAPEECDGLDTNCDGTVEENWHVDADGDGFGDPDRTEVLCEGVLDGHVQDGTDCDDGSAEIHPGADEVCDGLDNDCDGLAADEDDPDQDGLLTCADCAPDDSANDCVPIDPDCVGEDCGKADVVVGSGACGCASPGGGGSWLAVMVAAALRRRRGRA